MNKKFVKVFIIAVVFALALSVFTACFSDNNTKKITYDDGVAKAFKAVPACENLISQTAVANGENYTVTVITSDAVSEYILNSEYRITDTKNIAERGTKVSVMVVDEAVSDLERAFNEALKLSGIAKADVLGFDFDRDMYMGKAVFKVEIEDAVAEYSYIFDAEDMSVIESKIELENTVVSGEESSYIGEKRAREIALETVGIGDAEAENFTLKSILNNGRKLYKVRFDYDGYRYGIDIDAVKGDIVKFAKSILDDAAQSPVIPEILDEETIKNIALEFAFPEGTDGLNVIFRKVKLDYEKGGFIYEVEFNEGYNEYEFEIAADTGEILDVEIDSRHAVIVDDDEHLPQNKDYLTREQAIAKVREVAGEDIFVLDVEIEKERGRYFYQVEIRKGNRELEYYVDAITGEVTQNDEYGGNIVTPAIGEDEAYETALRQFGLSSEQITYKKIKLERDDGILIYDIKLKSGKTEYSIEIDAQSGKVISYETENDDDDEPLPPETDKKFLSEAEAREKIKQELGNDVVIEDIELESKRNGNERVYYYEVEVIINGREYEYIVDAYTGEIKLAAEYVDAKVIGEEKAIEIALSYFSVSSKEAIIIKVKLDEDDGRYEYEVKFRVRDVEYTVEIDAESGRVLDFDRSFD